MKSDRPDIGNVLSLNLPVEISAIENARLAMLSYLRPFDLDDRVINRIEVVLEELLSNVVRHAEGAERLAVKAEIVDQGVRLTIEDDGVVFNPFDAPEPERLAVLEDAMLGGQGIPLIKKLSQSVRYDRAGAINRVSAVIGPR